MDRCKECGKEIKNIDFAMTKKIKGKASEEYYCIECLAKMIHVSHDTIIEIAKDFKRQGCSLFTSVEFDK